MDCTKLIEREGWDCAKCGHRHAGRTLANICIGCSCQETSPQETERPSLGSDRVDRGSNVARSAGNAEELSSSSALSTLRTSLRALRDKMRQLSRDRFDQFQNQPETIIGISAACYGVFADELDALIGDTP